MEYSISADKAQEQVEIVKNFQEVNGDKITLVVEGEVQDKNSLIKMYGFIRTFFFKDSGEWRWRLR